MSEMFLWKITMGLLKELLDSSFQFIVSNVSNDKNFIHLKKNLQLEICAFRSKFVFSFYPWKIHVATSGLL